VREHHRVGRGDIAQPFAKAVGGADGRRGGEAIAETRRERFDNVRGGGGWDRGDGKGTAGRGDKPVRKVVLVSPIAH
jgi:hypothetical protein